MREICARPKVLLAIALEAEAFVWHPSSLDVVTVITGIGKACAATALTEAIMRHHPIAVINAGTAGTLDLAVGDIVACTHFYDRDLQSLDIAGVTWEQHTQRPVFNGRELDSIISGRRSTEHFAVSTGDTFVTGAYSGRGDAVDMEAFAEAMVCRRFNLPFVAVKYVTDVIDRNSLKLWEDKLYDASVGLATYFQHLAL